MKTDAEAKKSEEGIAWYFGTLIFINSLVGAGVLNFPHSIHAAGGISTAICVQIVIMLLQFAAVTSMVWCSHLKGAHYYQDTIREYLGPFGQYFCAVVMFCYCLLLTCTYVIAIGQQMTAAIQILCDLAGFDIEIREDIVIGVVMLIFVAPFCLVDHLDKLHYASAVASFSVLLVGAIVIFEFFHTDTSDVDVRTSPTSWSSIFLAIPAYAVAYMMDLTSVAVYSRLRNKSVMGFVKAAGLALGLVFVFYNVFSGFVYCTFGSNINSNVMTNYVEKSYPVAIAQIFYSFKLCLEYPIFQFLGWTAVRTIICSDCTKTESETEKLVNKVETDLATPDPDTYPVIRALTSAIWIVISLLVSWFAKDIDQVLPLASATVLHFQFTFPGLCLFKAANGLSSDRRKKTLKACAVFFILLGTCLSGIIVIQYAMGIE